jgi:hypothetical protein
MHGIYEIGEPSELRELWRGNDRAYGLIPSASHEEPCFVFGTTERLELRDLSGRVLNSVRLDDQPYWGLDCQEAGMVLWGERDETLLVLDSNLRVTKPISYPRSARYCLARDGNWVAVFGCGGQGENEGVLCVSLKEARGQWHYRRERLVATDVVDAGSDTFLCGWEDGLVCLIDCRQEKCLWQAEPLQVGDLVRSVQLHTRSNVAVALHESGAFRARDARSGLPIWDQVLKGAVDPPMVTMGPFLIMPSYEHDRVQWGFDIGVYQMTTGELTFLLFASEGEADASLELATCSANSAVTYTDKYGRIARWQFDPE